MTPNVSLRDATRALRATSGESHDAEGTRRRVLGTVAYRERARRQLIVGAVALLLGFPFGATAYAAFFGAPAFVQTWIDQLTSRPVESPAQPSTTGTATKSVQLAAPTLEAASAVDVTPATASAPTAEIATTTEAAAPTRLQRRAVAASESIAETNAVATPPTPAPNTDALYARAHELHFVIRDPQAALDAWNAYIAQAPSAALLLEARYNRALCLIRLHRDEDALIALAPFAHGAHGSYRQREALALTRALSK